MRWSTCISKLLIPVLPVLIAVTHVAGDGVALAGADIPQQAVADTISALEQAVAEGDAQSGDYIRLGHAYLATEDWNRAKKAFQRAIKLGAEAAGHNGIGLVYLNTKGRGRSAIDSFRRALKKDPAFVDAQYNLALAYRRFRPKDALEAFEKVLELAPRHADAAYCLGQVLEDRGDPDGAMAAYRRQIEAHPGHGLASSRLGKLLLDRDERQEAMAVFEGAMAAGDAPGAYLEMAILSQEAREFERAQQLFDAYIGSLPEEEQQLYRDISLVAGGEELDLYASTPDDRKEEMARRFWNRHDPAPLSAANERLLEHYRRVAYAREHYARGKFPWDDRGDVYVRFGPPDHISRSDDIQGERDSRIRDARIDFVNRLRIGLEVRPGLPIFPVQPNVRWEYWVYADIDGGIEITFVSEYGNRQYRFAPLPEGLSPSLSLELMDLHGDVVVRKVAARQPSIYTADFADLPIDFYYYTAGYRGAEARTRLEIYYGLPASEVARLTVDEKTDLMVLERGLALYDSLWNEVHRVRDELAFRAPSEQQVLKGAFIPGVLPIDLAPGPYHMALQVRDVLSDKSQVYQQEIVLEDYRGEETLQISDIELAFSISQADSGGDFVKQGLKVIPMSSRAFRADQHAFVYFEIYNLARDEFGRTQYRVEYTFRSYEKRAMPVKILRGIGRLFRLAEKDQEIVIAYDQAGDLRDEVAYVELDLTKSEPGGQRVRVSVTDLLTEREESKEITFKIVP